MRLYVFQCRATETAALFLRVRNPKFRLFRWQSETPGNIILKITFLIQSALRGVRNCIRSPAIRRSMVNESSCLGGAAITSTLTAVMYRTWPSTIILLVYKYPTQVGDSVYQRIPQAVGDTSVFLYVTMATDTVVQTPAGSFPCIRYRSSSQDSVIVRDIYVSPGVGKVKSVLLRSNTTLARREESLVLYKLY